MRLVPINELRIEYVTYGKAVAPAQVRMTTSSWAGEPQKMVDGSEPQPWHCLPFVEGSTYGLELVFQHDAPCQVINEGGAVRFEWDISREGAEVTGGEFMLFAPRKAPKYYLFNTRIDIEPPAGHVIRTEPHPRYFTDDTGTVPLSMIGHLQNEWWPRRVFVVFRVPPPGQRHIFRKGEGYAQVIFVPQRVSYHLQRMGEEKEKRRRKLERTLNALQHHLASNVWQNPDGTSFSDYYKVLASAFVREGMAGVEKETARAIERHKESLPADKSIVECLEMADRRLAEKKYVAAGEVYQHVLAREPGNAAALRGMSIVVRTLGSPVRALELMAKAAANSPDVALYQAEMGEMFRLLGRMGEAEGAFRAALAIEPRDAAVMALLARTLAGQGKRELAIEAAQGALRVDPGCEEALGVLEEMRRANG